MTIFTRNSLYTPCMSIPKLASGEYPSSMMIHLWLSLLVVTCGYKFPHVVQVHISNHTLPSHETKV